MTKLNGPMVLLPMLACSAAMLLSAEASAGETSFEMAAYADWPGGKEIEAGDYDAVIAKTTARGWRFDATISLVATTNRCVAFTLKRELAEAERSCAAALTLAVRADRSTYGRFPRESATSKALSNRGVLRALAGSAADAAADFREAAAIRGADGAPNRNLAHLENSPVYRVALLRAASE
jgi:hypothetical protein